MRNLKVDFVSGSQQEIRQLQILAGSKLDFVRRKLC